LLLQRSRGYLSIPIANYDQQTLRKTRQSIMMVRSNSVIDELTRGQPKNQPTTTTRTRSTAAKTNEKLKRDIVALKIFFSLHGHYRVPYTYVIPNGTSVRSTNGRIRRKSTSATASAAEGVDDEGPCVSESYPSETHGLRLGLRVARIRKGELYTATEQRARLAEIGLKLDLHPDLQLATPFTILSSQETATTTMTTAGTEDTTGPATGTAEDEFDSQLQWSARAHAADQKFQLILSALQVHDDLYGDMLVPRYFVVPAEHPWPPAAWDMQLGNRVRNIRARRAYNKPRYHQQLTDVGFVFTLGDCQIQTSWSSTPSSRKLST
jgi:hypothetical protein